jgi:hypothetical protein
MNNESTSTENTIPKQRGRPFVKGQSGNPAGKPKGSLHYSTRAAMALLEGEAETITRKAVELALAGDLQAIKLVLERVIPARKERPVSITLPEIDTARDVMVATKQVINNVAAGELTPGEGQTMLAMLDNVRKAIESESFEQRLNKLEANLGKE